MTHTDTDVNIFLLFNVGSKYNDIIYIITIIKCVYMCVWLYVSLYHIWYI